MKAGGIIRYKQHYFLSECFITTSQKAVAHTRSIMVNTFVIMHCLLEQADFIYIRFVIIRMLTRIIIIISSSLNKPSFFCGIIPDFARLLHKQAKSARRADRLNPIGFNLARRGNPKQISNPKG